jgi:PAS domain S-box-containing protein
MMHGGLMEHSRWFRALVEHAQDWIVVLDAEGVIRYASPSIERVLGYSPAERVGRPGLELVHPEDRPRVEAALEDLSRRPGEGAHVEMRCRHADGSWRVLDTVGRNLLDEPSVRGLLVSARDITELVHSRARREAMLRVARQFAVETAPERLMLQLLTEAVELTGGSCGLVARWDEQHQALQPVSNTLPVNGEPVEIRIDQGAGGQAAARREPVIINDYQHAMAAVPEALEAGLQAVVSAPLLHEARLLGVVTVASDAPGKRFTAEDAGVLQLLAGVAGAVLVGMERSRLEGVLLAARTAQHALNNQLALAIGYAELLAADPRLPNDLRELAEEAVTGARSAAAIVQQFQRIIRLEEVDQAGPGSILDLARASHAEPQT